MQAAGVLRLADARGGAGAAVENHVRGTRLKVVVREQIPPKLVLPMHPRALSRAAPRFARGPVFADSDQTPFDFLGNVRGSFSNGRSEYRSFSDDLADRMPDGFEV